MPQRSPSPQELLNSARHVQAVGPRHLEQRPAARWPVLAKLAKLTAATAVLVGGLHVGSHVFEHGVPQGAYAETGPAVVQVASSPVSHAGVSHAGVSHAGVSHAGVSHAETSPSAVHAHAPSTPQVILASPGHVAPPHLGPAVKLPIPVASSDTTIDLVRKYLKTGLTTYDEAFQGMTLAAEEFRAKPYNIEGRHAAEYTIGVGYNLLQNLNTLGRPAVQRDLSRSGFSPEDAQRLTSGDPRQITQVTVTPQQGLSLLAVSGERYKSEVRDAIGAKAFDKLPVNQQAALTWSNYNGFFHRNKADIVQGVRAHDSLAVIMSMTTTVVVDGRRIDSPNVILAQAAFYSHDHLRQVVANQTVIKTAGKDGALAFQQQIHARTTPSSPSAHHDNAPLTVLASPGHVTPAQSAPSSAPAPSSDASASQAPPVEHVQAPTVKLTRGYAEEWRAQHAAQTPSATPSSPAPATPSPGH